MRLFLALVLWTILLVICWPLALLVLVAFPVLWIRSIPFRVVGYVVEGVLALVTALLFLPARVVSLGKA